MKSDRVLPLAWYITLTCTVVSSEPLYILSSSAKCPTGSSHLQSSSDCKSAAEGLFLPDGTPEDVSNAAWPEGCFIRDSASSHRLYFNPAGFEDSAVIDVRVLCSWAPVTTTSTVFSSSSAATIGSTTSSGSTATVDSSTSFGGTTTTGSTVSSTGGSTGTTGTGGSSNTASGTTTTVDSSITTIGSSITTIGTPLTTTTAGTMGTEGSTTTIGTPSPTPAPPPPDDGLGYRGSCSTSINLQDPDNIFMPERNTTSIIPSIPASFDARDQWPHCFDGVSIPAQGGCGSCWAFAPAAVTRHRACIYDCEQNSRCDSSNVLYGRHLSVQQILGCGSSRAGCDGGWAYQAYDAMMERLAWSADVPYQCQHGNVVDQFNPSAGSCVRWPWNTADYPQACSVENEHVSVIGHYRLPLHKPGVNAAAVMAAELVSNGPLAIDFCIRHNFFSFWSSDKTRIYTDADGCKHGDVVGGHMAMLVGFNERSGLQYWILQNSWSDAWAHDGFFYMQRGINLCGVENKASAPEVRVSVAPLTFTTRTSTTTAATTSAGTSTTAAVVTSAADSSTSLSTTLGTTNTDITKASTTSLEVLWPVIIPGLRTTTTTTTASVDVSLAVATESSSEEANGVPWALFWIIMSVMIVLIGGLAVTATVLWQRHATLRKSLRSQRPNLIPGSGASWSSSRLRENPDTVTPTNSGENRAQMVGVCTGIPVDGNVASSRPVTGHVTANPQVHPQANTPTSQQAHTPKEL
mmetsp:Transcript_39287/g.62223  ORF Transcript_39287/g.62223 Transcript_39287/m.62223 type:complete len:746 (+) Transcript_39287:54-2291(+)